MSAWSSRGLGLALLCAIAIAVPFGCGGGAVGGAGAGGGSGGAGSSGNAGTMSNGTSTMTGSLVTSGTAQLESLTVTPDNASITVSNGVPQMQAFVAKGHFSDNTTQVLTSNVSWGADNLSVGNVDQTGLYTAMGAQGGVVHVQASFGGMKASATLTVKLSFTQNPANAPSGVQTALQGATTPDASVVWAYPYDGTVWPRGLLAPILQWNGGAATDTYYVHLVNSTFELEQFATVPSAPAAQLPIDETTWDAFVDSSAGDTKVTVARWDGANATVIANHTWTIAPGSMKGTIYYWSNNLGRVLRIQPGAAMPDDFANQAPLNDTTQYQDAGCLMTCHTVSADGSTLVSGGGTFGGSYDLKSGMPIHYLGGTWGVNPNMFGLPEWQNIQWLTSAVSATGKYVLLNGQVNQLSGAASGPTNLTGLFLTADGSQVANSGFDGLSLFTPAWSPPDNAIAYVTNDDSPWAAGGNGDLHVMSFDATQSPMASNDQLLVPSSGNAAAPNISWPTFTPDGKWLIYQRGQSSTTWNNNQADLYFTSATAPGVEVPLDQLNGTNYPFAAGARDLHEDFEPAFAPVASGGYFWVVFTSRRTYGTRMTGPAFVTSGQGTKQLWVAAIDQNPQPGKDPSHPAFHLTGQDEGNLAMRGFWALNPCKGDGQGCMSGVDCCGGYCDMSNGGVCSSTSGGCSQTGDKCDTDADCCGASQGTTCINHVCSEAPPK